LLIHRSNFLGQINFKQLQDTILQLGTTLQGNLFRGAIFIFISNRVTYWGQYKTLLRAYLDRYKSLYRGHL